MKIQKIKAGIIGSGFGERVMLPCLTATKKIDVIAFVSRDPKKIEASAKQYGVDHAVSTVDELLDIKEVELICIVTPPFLHCETVKKIAGQGKHILCEKPMALNIREASEMVDAAQKTSCLNMINHQLRFQINLRKIKDLLVEGTLGEVRHFQLTYLTASRYDSTSPWNWWSDINSGGGQLNAIGSHFIDLLKWWFGDIASVQGKLKTFNKARPLQGTSQAKEVTTDEYASFDLKFMNGIFGSFVTSSVVSDEPGIELRIVGELGSVVLDRNEQLFLFTKDGKKEEITKEDPLLEQPIIGFNRWRTSLVYYAHHIYDAIRNGKPFEGATFQDGLRTQEALEAVRISDREKRKVDMQEVANSSGVKAVLR